MEAIEGEKGSSPQPEKPRGAPAGLWVRAEPVTGAARGLCQEVVCHSVSSGPAQARGLTRKGSPASPGHSRPSDCSSPVGGAMVDRQLPRSGSWDLSPGSPQRMNLVLKNSSTWEMFRSVARTR